MNASLPLVHPFPARMAPQLALNRLPRPQARLFRILDPMMGHLPDEVLGLINNWVLHKIGDSNVVSRLRRSIGGVDDSLWSTLPNLAPGQAVVSFSNLSRPLMVAIDPTPCRPLMVE